MNKCLQQNYCEVRLKEHCSLAFLEVSAFPTIVHNNAGRRCLWALAKWCGDFSIDTNAWNRATTEEAEASLCTSDKRSHPCLNVSDQSLLHEITLHCEDKIWWKTVLKMTNTHSLGKKIPPNCVNNVAPLITLARCKMGLVLMLGHTAWNIQIEVPYIRQRFLIYFIIFFWHTIGECLITQPFSDSHVEMLIWLSKHNYAAEGQPRHFLALFIKNMRIKVRLLTTKRQDTELRR